MKYENDVSAERDLSRFSACDQFCFVDPKNSNVRLASAAALRSAVVANKTRKKKKASKAFD
jgi:hypothetical protein